MGRDPIAKPLYEAGLAAHERARQQRLGGDAHDRRGGRAHGLQRSQDPPRLSHRAGVRHCRLQGPKTNLAPLEPAIAPAYSAGRWTHDRLGFAAGRLSAPNFRTRYAWLRPAGNKMQIAMKLSIKSGIGALALSVFALNALALAMASRAVAFTAYVSNEKGNSISIIDTGKLEVT